MSAKRAPGRPLTPGNIHQLQVEAGEHGDPEMVNVCQAALDGDSAAWTECERVIFAARANHDESEEE